MIPFRTCATAAAALCLIPLSLAFVGSPEQPLPHPHFRKVIDCELKRNEHLKVSHITVTLDKAGAKKMAVGDGWHLGGAELETDLALKIGGHDVAPGKYALSARKTAKGWALTLHKGAGFSRFKKKDGTLVEGLMDLKTEFVADSAEFEHLSCDVQPGGDKKSTQLFLDVRFDTMLARCLIELPAK
jgi:hypothetical protein